MKKVIIIWLTVCILASLAGMPVLAAEDDTASVSDHINSSHSLDAENTLLGAEQLVKNASSVILFETNSQSLMYQWNADEATDPASLVKIMTGLIVCENGNMEDVVRASKEVLDTIGSGAATVDLQVDEVMTVEQLLYCMLVSSANDAAVVLADHIAGSQDAFVEMMNTRAEELGCTNTNFANVHGLNNENQYSSARDLAKILNEALRNETFRDAFGAIQYSIPPTNKSDIRDITTGNYLMSMEDVQVYYDERVTGGRTGISAAGLRCLATCAQSGNMELICVVMGSESKFAENGRVQVFGGYQETIDMLNKGFNGMHLTQVIGKNQVVAQRAVSNGDCDVILGSGDSTIAILPVAIGMEDLNYRFVDEKELVAPIEKGEIVCSVEIWHENLCVAETQLYAMNGVAVQENSVIDSINPKEDGSSLWTVLIVLAAAVFLLFLLRKGVKAIRYSSRSRSRQYRADHRRSR